MKIKKQKYVTKRKVKFEDHKNCLATTQHENEMNQLEKKYKNLIWKPRKT